MTQHTSPPPGDAPALSIARRVLAVLEDGPATTGEVAAETGLRSNLAGTHLRNLLERGKIEKGEFRPGTPQPFRGNKPLALWALPGQLPKGSTR